MSRLLDMLRRPRRDGPPPWDEPAHEADLHNHSTAAARAIVLDTLSGVRRRAPWYRRRLTFVLAALGLAAVVFCVMAIGRRPAGDRPATQPPRDSRSASDTSRDGPRVQPPDRRPSDARGSTRAPRPDAVEERTLGRSDASASGRSNAQTDAPRRPGPTASTGARPPAGAGSPAPAAATPQPIPAAPAANDTSREDERFKRALRYQQSGDVADAIAEYRALLQANDSNAQAHNNLGLLYQGQGRMEDAIAEFRRAIAIDSGYAKARNNLGAGLLRAGDVEAAAGEFRRVLSVEPRNQEAMVNLGLSQRAAGRSDEARETLIRAIEIDDRSAVAHYNLALLYEEAREIVRALDHYEAYLKYAAGSDASQVAAVRDHCQALRQRLIKF